jgi:hypothetical protein
VSTVPVPAGATAVALNLTATNATDPGFLTAYPCGGTRPVASNLNAGVGQTVANLAVVPAAPNGSVCVFASGRTDVVVDLLGTFGPSGLRYQALTPVRLLDTRAGTGAWSGRPAARQALDLPAVPGAAALSVTLTAVTPAADGYATVYPCGAAPPLASNLNYVGWSSATANSATVASPACVVAQARSHAVVDMAGYWVA